MPACSVTPIPPVDPRPPAEVPRLPRPPAPGRLVPPDRGQSTVAVALVVALALLLIVGLTRLGTAAVDRARARTAADAAALAGVVEEHRGGGAGRRAATEVAARNGARLVAYEADGATVEVTVQIDDAHATSRAERVVDAGA